MVEKQAVLDYLGIDYVDDMVNRTIDRLIKVCDATLKGALGDNYPSTDPRAEELQLAIIDDLYSNRGINSKTGGDSTKLSGNTRKLINDLEQQLRLEMRRSNAGI